MRTSRHLLHFGIDSCWRLQGKRWGRIRLVDAQARQELGHLSAQVFNLFDVGPDFAPVVRAEVATTYGKACELLNARALPWRNLSPTWMLWLEPLPNRYCADAELPGKSRPAAAQFHRSRD